MTQESHIPDDTYPNGTRTPSADGTELFSVPSATSVEAPSGEPSPAAPAPAPESRHGVHHPNKHHFSLWMDIELLARFRRRAKEVGISASDLFVRVLGPLEHVVLLPEDYEWIERRKKQGQNRRY